MYSQPLLNFFLSLLCYSLNLKLITLRFRVTGLHTIPHNVKVELCFLKFVQIHSKLKAEMSRVKYPIPLLWEA